MSNVLRVFGCPAPTNLEHTDWYDFPMKVGGRTDMVSKKLKSIAKNLFQMFGVGITSHENLVRLQERAEDRSGLSDFARKLTKSDLEFIRLSGPDHYELLINNLSRSKSQLRQDLFALSETGKKTGGFFVEFGATDGIKLSNTYLLESEFGWRGILAEPAKAWHPELRKNRPNAAIETRCVWKDSGSTLTFNETKTLHLSTVDSFSNSDMHEASRQTGKRYDVETISLNDLLEKHQAPDFIDYLSIDTEGSEHEILKELNFDKYSFQVITVEHNYTPQRDLIFELLTKHGYERKFQTISRFDDWYTRQTSAN